MNFYQALFNANVSSINDVLQVIGLSGRVQIRLNVNQGKDKFNSRYDGHWLGATGTLSDVHIWKDAHGYDYIMRGKPAATLTIDTDSQYGHSDFERESGRTVFIPKHKAGDALIVALSDVEPI